MSEEQLKAFIEKVKIDKELQERLNATTNPETAMAIAKEAGFIIQSSGNVEIFNHFWRSRDAAVEMLDWRKTIKGEIVVKCVEPSNEKTNMSNTNGDQLEKIAGKLTRARNLLHAMRSYEKTGATRMNYLEIGTCFKSDEGLSTLLAATFLRETGMEGHVWSLEGDPSHINACRELIEKEDNELLSLVTHIEGMSPKTMPKAMAEINEVDIAFIDGGADARVNLFELEALLPKLSANGVIVIDDVVWLAQTTAYRGRRDFGKAQMILPMLCIADNINYCLSVITERHGGSEEEVLAALNNWPGTSGVFSTLANDETLRKFWKALSDFDFAKVNSQIFLARKNMLHGALGFEAGSNLIAAKLPSKQQ